MQQTSKLAWLALTGTLMVSAQPAHPAGTPAEVVVTVGHYFSQIPPTLTRDDLIVTQDSEALVVTNLIPLRGDRAGLELFVIVDNCSNCEPGSKFEELRRFIDAQPPTTAVGVASIDGGRLNLLVYPTPDRARAVKALSVPAGGKPSSPFDAVAELIQNWPQTTSRRAVLLISNGIDPATNELFLSRSAETALETAQRAGVTFYAIYHPSADYTTTDWSKLHAGQVLLAHVANETGGESYFVGFGPLPSFGPMLADLSDHLKNSYLLRFLAIAAGGPGALQEISVKSKVPDVDVMAPLRVWIPGHPPGSPDGEKPSPKR
jgi:hypothetical protein